MQLNNKSIHDRNIKEEVENTLPAYSCSTFSLDLYLHHLCARYSSWWQLGVLLRSYYHPSAILALTLFPLAGSCCALPSHLIHPDSSRNTWTVSHPCVMLLIKINVLCRFNPLTTYCTHPYFLGIRTSPKKFLPSHAHGLHTYSCSACFSSSGKPLWSSLYHKNIRHLQASLPTGWH